MTRLTFVTMLSIENISLLCDIMLKHSGGMSFFFSILNYFVCQVDGTHALIKQKMCQTENNLHILPPAPTIFVGKQGIYRHFYTLEKYLIKLANNMRDALLKSRSCSVCFRKYDGLAYL